MSKESVLARLSEFVITPLERISGRTALAVPWVPGGDPSTIPLHPICRDRASSRTCRESWQAHLRALDSHPDAHWHRCDHGYLCAVVPVVRDRRCLAACKLVCPGSMTHEAFERNVEILTLLVERFTTREADLLSAWIRSGGDPGRDPRPRPAAPERFLPSRARHPRVLKAMEHIDQHLTDSSMTVTSIARHLHINPAYLGHLFSQQVGMRMHRYIVTRRIELAKRLLATTDSLVKQVAHESGHRNADWFIQVFHAHTGVTPGEFRHNACGRRHG